MATPQELARLVERLNADTFYDRKTAEGNITAMGPGIFGQLDMGDQQWNSLFPQQQMTINSILRSGRGGRRQSDQEKALYRINSDISDHPWSQNAQADNASYVEGQARREWADTNMPGWMDNATHSGSTPDMKWHNIYRNFDDPYSAQQDVASRKYDDTVWRPKAEQHGEGGSGVHNPVKYRKAYDEMQEFRRRIGDGLTGSPANKYKSYEPTR
jgi:hypothetical protein